MLNDKRYTVEQQHYRKRIKTILKFTKVTINHQIYDAIPNLRTGSRRDMGLAPFNSGPLDLSEITMSRS